MPTSTHSFAGANTDDEVSAAGMGAAFTAATNISLEPGQVYPITGNVLVGGYALPARGTNVSRGALPDGATGTAIEFLYNSAGAHRLIRYDPQGNGGAGSRTTLLEWAGLKLAPDLVLTGGVLDNIVVYRDAEGEVRAINLLRAAAGAYTAAYLAAEPFALHLIKVPPQGTIRWRRELETTGVFGESLRIIPYNAYQFAMRYRYVDGEQTVIGSYSTWADILFDPSVLTFNVLVLTLPTPIPLGVVEVEVLVREPDGNIFQVADTLRRDATGQLPTTFRFYGQYTGGAVTDDEQARLFENLWPCHTGPTLARSRVHAADFLEGYPTPQPAFTAEVVTGNDNTYQADVYQLTITDRQPSDEFPGSTQDVYYSFYYLPTSGTYPDPASTYIGVTVYDTVGGVTRYVVGAVSFTYQQAFVDPQPGIQNEVYREVNVLPNTTILRSDATPDTLTFHEDSPYPVSIQFYDALGRPFGAAKPVTVFIPARAKGDMAYKSIRATLTTTDPAQLNVEIPPQAYTYQWLVGINGRTKYVLQGLAADVLGYLGQKTVVNTDTNVSTDYENVVDGLHNPHEKLLVDIGNWPAAGMGYVHDPQSQAVLRFKTDGKQYPIIAQRGDYLEIARTDYPTQDVDANGRCFAPIEIYVPNLTPSDILYERGRRLPVLRRTENGQEYRSYGEATTLLEGDTYLVYLNFPIPDRSDPDAVSGSYVPPRVKSYVKAPSPTLVESMVPPFRLAPSYTTRVTEYTRNPRKSAFETFISNPLNLVVPGLAAYNLLKYSLDKPQDNRASTTTEVADTVARRYSALLWLDASYGGRPAVVVPTQLQQVRRLTLERFSGFKVKGTEINGLSRWEALNQYDELPQEDGEVVALVVANQSQATGKVLLALMQRGVTSLYLGQQPIQTSGSSVIISQTKEVIGGDNDLQISCGCTDPGTVAQHESLVFWFSRERAELMRYNKGLTRLAITYKFRARLEALTARYHDAEATGCFDPRREEYWLTFHPTEQEPVGTTVVWSERRQAWADEVLAVPTVGAGVGNELVMWQGGELYRHLPTAPAATFFGQYGRPQLTFVASQPGGNLAKTWQQISVHALGQWVPAVLTTPAGQRSRILPAWQRFIQGAWRAAVRRDENSTGGLHGGRVLQSDSLAVTLTGPDVASPLVGASVDYLVNTGQFSNQ